MIRRPPRSTLDRSSAASDVYKRQGYIDEGTSQDYDGDGWYTPDDCDDYDYYVNPGATEYSDGQDNDCDGYIDEVTSQDYDGDGWYTPDDLSLIHISELTRLLSNSYAVFCLKKKNIDE